MNVFITLNVKFKEIWTCFILIVFISWTNATPTTGSSRTAIIIKEDPLVDKLTKVNHNLKLVKLKKVKKVFTNLQDDDSAEQNQISKKPTIVDLNTKYSVVTQTPIPFLILDKPINQDLNDINSNDKIVTNQNSRDYDLKNKLNAHEPPNSVIKTELEPNSLKDEFKDKKSKSSILNSRLKKLDDDEHNKYNQNKYNQDKFENNNFKSGNESSKFKITDHKKEPNQRAKSIKALFPSSGNKFKQSLSHLNRPNQISFNSLANRSTSSNPFASSSNKSTFRVDFLNKTTTDRPAFKTTTTIKPTTKKLIKSDKFKLYTTTTEAPRTYTYKPIKKTTTYQPYIYTTISVSTSNPILRIRKSKPTIYSNKIKATTASLINKEQKIHAGKDESTKSTENYSDLDKEKTDLESNNSNRKYAKLSFDQNKSSRDRSSTDSKVSTTLTPTTRNYLKTNSRVSIFSSLYTTTEHPTTTYKPYTSSVHYTTNKPETRRHFTETTTIESSIKNEINSDKTLTAVRKRPIYRPRTVKPTNGGQLTTISPSIGEISTIESRLTTNYSPRFRSTTEYPAKFRSTTTESSVSDRFTTRFKYSTPESTTSSFKYKEKETNFYRSKPVQEDNQIDYTIKTDLPIRTATTESSILKNYLTDNLIPRKPKWVLKSTRQRKSDYGDSSKESTTPIFVTTEKPITRQTFATTTKSELIDNSNEQLNKLPEYKTVERSPKSAELYQLQRPKPFLIPLEKNPTDEKLTTSLSRLKSEEPKKERIIESNSIDTSPEREIYYQDAKIRKESKLVPQTYLYSTSSPLNQLNERLSYLNDEKLKYQRTPYANSDYHRKPTYSEEDEDRRPKYPNSIPYLPEKKYSKILSYLPENKSNGKISTELNPHVLNPKYQNTRYNYENRPYSSGTNKPPQPTTSQPYVRSHFNLGSSNDIGPKYGPIFKQVGKLSEAFTHQPPIPYLAPEISVNQKDNQPNKENDQSVRYPINEQQNYNIDLKRYRPPSSRNQDDNQVKPIGYPIDNEPIEYPINKQPDSTRSQQGSNEIDRDKFHKHRVNSETIKPFDFSDYKPLPNFKFIRTDLENNDDQADKKYKDRPKVSTDYYANTEPHNQQFTHYPSHHSDHNNDRLVYPPPQTEKVLKFNFNKIPAKVVYDKYNQQFVGRINLNKQSISPKLMPKHYADIPKHVRPIEYERPTYNMITVNPLIDQNKPVYKPVYKPTHRPTYKPIYKPIYSEPLDKKPIYEPVVNNYPNDDSNRYRQEIPIYRPINPVNNQHIPNNLNKLRENIHSSRHNELPRYNEAPRYSDDLKYPKIVHNQANRFKDQFNNNQFNDNQFNNNQINNNQINNNQFNNRPPNLFNRVPEYRQENNHHLNDKPIYNSQFKNARFDNAGHYDDQIIPLRPNKDVELINLNDISPNLSLWQSDKMPDFKLLQNTIISHDLPTYKYL